MELSLLELKLNGNADCEMLHALKFDGIEDPDEIIRILNDVPVHFLFEDDDDHHNGDGETEEKVDHVVAPSTQLLDKLEALNGIEKRLGVYNQSERIERINAYRQRRQQLNFNHSRVRYVVRQRASTNRVRIHGRFALEAETSPRKTKNAANHKVEQDIDFDQPADKLMRRTTASSSSLSWLVQHHCKSNNDPPNVVAANVAECCTEENGLAKMLASSSSRESGLLDSFLLTEFEIPLMREE